MASPLLPHIAMIQVIAAVVALLLSPGEVPAQSAPDRPAAGINRETGAPGSAGPKDDGVVQRGNQPNPGEVRPGSPEGDQPSAAAGELRRKDQVRRIFGLPVMAAVLIGVVIVGMLALAGAMLPGARRREKARGGGTYGPKR